MNTFSSTAGACFCSHVTFCLTQPLQPNFFNEQMVSRETAETLMNRYSSRSHSIFLLTVSRQRYGVTRFAQLYLVDLAGSECALKSGATGVRLAEAGHINRSLLTLGMCVNALCEQSNRDRDRSSEREERLKRSGAAEEGVRDEGKVYVPYRDSKLTRLLQNALGGNSATWLMVSGQRWVSFVGWCECVDGSIAHQQLTFMLGSRQNQHWNS
jgi:hypothetical protein